MTIKVVLADDHALMRAGLRAMLEAYPDVTVLGEAENGEVLLELAQRLHPHIVLMDLAMPRLNGLDTTDRLSKKLPMCRVIILSMHQDEDYVRQALRSGAAGYLLKDSAPAELELAIKAVARGETYLSPGVSRGVVSDYVNRLRQEAPDGNRLSPRLRQVLVLIAEGKSTKEMAALLGLSVKTVDTHRTLLMKQLDIHDVAGLVRYAMRERLV